MKALFLGPSGGTASGMAAFEKSFCQRARDYDIWLVPGMWRTLVGLTNCQLIKANPNLVDDWDKIGGSPIIPSCKDTNVFKVKMENGEIVDLSDRVKTFCNGVEGIIAVGGDGTTFQAQELKQEKDINSIVALATMDNNIPCFDNTIGFETAVLNAANSIQACVNDAMTMQRPTIIFGMGYDTGRLLVNAVKVARKRINPYGGKIDLLQIPETKTDADDLAKHILKTYKGYGPYIVAISEGCAKVVVGTDNGKHKVFDTNAYAKKIQDLTGIEFKVLHTDYMQRSTAPCIKDIRLAKRFAIKTADLVDRGEWNLVVGAIGNKIVAKSVDEVRYILKNTKSSIETWYNTQLLSLDELRDILI